MLVRDALDGGEDNLGGVCTWCQRMLCMRVVSWVSWFLGLGWEGDDWMGV